MTTQGLLALLIVVLAGIGFARTLRKLGQRKWRSTREPTQREVTRVLRRVTFTKHALDQFAIRAGLAPTSYGEVVQIIRDLLGEEGRVRTDQPTWARSRNTADLYLQAGEWMLFILRHDRWLPWRYHCVTAVNGPEDNTWENALRRGYIHTPVP